MTVAKPALRRRMRAARGALAADARAAAHGRMAAHLAQLAHDLDAAAYVALYAGQRDEADARALLTLRPSLRTAWPRVAGGDIELVACAAADLVPGFRGILEPPPGLAPLTFRQLAMIVVPGLAFDRDGHRLGRGGGHYDRLLARLRATEQPVLVVGLAYAVQIVERIPHEAHDQPVDVVITEHGPQGGA